MIGALAVIGVIAWFYLTAVKLGENPVYWVVVGVIGYYIIAKIWRLGVAEPMMNMFASQSPLLSLLISHSPVISGLIAAVFIRKKFLVNKKTNSE
ncbi:MAG: hypothetical protein V3U75_11380 [Methylococcaceae bacterium]